VPVGLEHALELHPQVALRTEPFGALAYHYGNRRLVFLKSPEVVALVRALDGHATVGDALAGCGVAPERWPTFVRTLDALERSEIVRER
jgi:putative mycofactocin binding protein MftB